MSQQRSQSRFPLALRLRITAANTDSPFEEMSADLSENGVFIRSGAPHAAGSLLKFELLAGEGMPPICGVGRVVWSRALAAADAAHPAGMGVKFLRLEGEGAQLLAEVRRRAGRAQSLGTEGERPMTGSTSGGKGTGDAPQGEAGSGRDSSDSDRSKAYDMAQIPGAPRSPALESMLRGVAREPYGDAKPAPPAQASSSPPKGVFSQPADVKQTVSHAPRPEVSDAGELSLSDPAVSADMMVQTFGMTTGFKRKKKLPSLPKAAAQQTLPDDDEQTVRLGSGRAQAEARAKSARPLNETDEFYRDSDAARRESAEDAEHEARSPGFDVSDSAPSTAHADASASESLSQVASTPVSEHESAGDAKGGQPLAVEPSVASGEAASQAIDLAALAGTAAALSDQRRNAQAAPSEANGSQDQVLDPSDARNQPQASAAASSGGSALGDWPQKRSRWWLPAAAILMLGAAVAWVIFEPRSEGVRHATPATEPGGAGVATNPVSPSAGTTEQAAEVDDRGPASSSATALAPEAPEEDPATAKYQPELLEAEGPRVPVVVNSRPGGAALTVEGKPFGKTPQRLALPEGIELTVEATKSGYVGARRTLVAARGEGLTIALEPIVYRVRMTSNPTGAEFLVGGRVVKAPDTLELPRVTSPLVIYARLPHHHKLRFVVNPDDFDIVEANASYHLHAELVARDYDKIAEELEAKRLSDAEAPAATPPTSSGVDQESEGSEADRSEKTKPSTPTVQKPPADAAAGAEVDPTPVRGSDQADSDPNLGEAPEADVVKTDDGSKADTDAVEPVESGAS